MNFILQRSAEVPPWFLAARFDVGAPGSPGRALAKDLNAVPGVDKFQGEWGNFTVVPVELAGEANTAARRHGFTVLDSRTLSAPAELSLFNSLGKFELFQKPDIERAVDAVGKHQAWLVAYAMGLGKTPVAIEVARRLAVQGLATGHEYCLDDILIVCPAMAREVWLHGNGRDFKDNGFARWWAERYSSEVIRGRTYCRSPFSIRDTGTGPHSLSRWVASTNPFGADSANDRTNQGRVVVVSYGMLRSLLDAVEDPSVPLVFDPRLIILDEAHYISNPKSAWSKACFKAAHEVWPDAKRLALTGTPLANPAEADGLHTVLDWLYPDRFGALKKFKWRYMNHEEAYDSKDNLRGYKYSGFNDEFKEELRLRLSACSSRLTKRDVAHLLPPFSASLVPYDGDRRVRASEFAVSLLQQGHDHIRVACFLHETADALTREVHKAAAKEKVTCSVAQVDGRHTPEARANTMATQRLAHRSITVATIDSTKVAIDLTFQSASVYAELTHKIEAVLQNLGRGHRASSVRGHDVFFLADETGDDLAAATCRKANTLAEIVGAGTEENAIQTTLGSLKTRGVTQEEIDEMLAMCSFGEDE